MNRWARRRHAALGADLVDDEVLLAACRVAQSRRSVRSGFPAPGRVFVLGVSDRRLLLWRTSPWLARPEALATSVPLEQVAAADLTQRLTGKRLRLVLATGPETVLEPVWGGSVRHLHTVLGAAQRR